MLEPKEEAMTAVITLRPNSNSIIDFEERRLQTTVCAETPINFEIDGRRMALGHVPDNGPINTLISVLGRVSEGNRGVDCIEFTRVAKKMTKEVLREIVVENECGDEAALMEMLPSFITNKPKAYVDALTQSARSAEMWNDSDAKWLKGGVFNKFESSHKESKDDNAILKPRGIYTMSEKLLVNLCVILHAQKLIYNTEFMKKHQIKGDANSEIYRKISEIAKFDHVSTDYSSFERTLRPFLRQAETELVCSVLTRLGYLGAAKLFRRVNTKGEKVRNAFLAFLHIYRMSGTYWTSLGNGVSNINLILYSSWMKEGNGKMSFKRWWNTIGKVMLFLAEGDDGLIPLKHVDSAALLQLGMKFKVNKPARGDGKVEFLRKLFVPEGVVVNVLRCMRGIWVKTPNVKLKLAKKLSLLRCAAYSMLYLSEGMPILTPLAMRIGELTKGYGHFKNMERYVDTWKITDDVIKEFAKPFPVVKVNEDLRVALDASTCSDIPRVSIEAQVSFEESLLKWNGLGPVELPVEFKAYPEYSDAFFALEKCETAERTGGRCFDVNVERVRLMTRQSLIKPDEAVIRVTA